MKTVRISALIDKLQDVMLEEGDLPVTLWDPYLRQHINIEPQDELYVVNENQSFGRNQIHSEFRKVVIL